MLAPLGLEDVHYASEPCGVLLHWLRELVLDRAKHAQLQLQLDAAKEELSAAEAAHTAAVQQLSELQAELEANRARQSFQEQVIANTHCSPTNTRGAEPASPSNGKVVGAMHLVDSAVARQRCRRGKLWRPAFDITGSITLTMTNLQNAKWWRSCERYKIKSPSSHCPDTPSKPGVKSFAVF